MTTDIRRTDAGLWPFFMYQLTLSAFGSGELKRVVVWEYGLRPLGRKEIDGLLVPPGKAYTLLTDHPIAG